MNNNQALIDLVPNQELRKYYYGSANSGSGVCDTSQPDPGVASACPDRDKKQIAGEKVPEQDKALLGQTLDLSEWEGVSFWARRGTDSQAGLRLLIGDKYTDDDISYIQYLLDPKAPRYCERTTECACRKQDRKCRKLSAADLFTYRPAESCDENVFYSRPLFVGDSICWDPEKDPPITTMTAGDFQFCGQSACETPSSSAKSLNGAGPDIPNPWLKDSTIPDYRDVQFTNTTCQPFSFRGSITSDFCYNPDSDIYGQQQPFDGNMTCNDHWMKSIAIDLDWKFYTVPFNTMLQQGWAKRSYMLDLTAISMVRFTWDRGYIDYYIDDVRFYRKKK
jgi:hypothetical protein